MIQCIYLKSRRKGKREKLKKRRKDQPVEGKEKQSKRKIKKNPFICALTACTSDDFKEKSSNSGMDGYMTKPISQKEIK